LIFDGLDDVEAVAVPVVVNVGGLGTDKTPVMLEVALFVTVIVRLKVQLEVTEVESGTKVTTSALIAHVPEMLPVEPFVELPPEVV